MNLDMLPYKLFKKLKTQYAHKMILVTDQDLTSFVAQALKDHRKYVQHRFLQEGVIIERYQHDYDSLETSSPKLGLVYLANDSEINPGIEVHALIGHNARWKDLNGGN